MSNEPAEITPGDPADSVPAVGVRPRLRGRKRRVLGRWTRRILVLAASIVAAAIFTLFTVDVGDVTINGKSLKTLAESAGSKWLERPLTIGHISAYITPGKFLLTNVRIAGPTQADRPFFEAKEIVVDVPWWTMLNQRQLYIEVRLAAWRMVVEKWPDGKTHLPKLKSNNPNGKPFPLKIRGLAVYGSDGEFIYDDHVTPWNVIGRNLKFDLVRANNLNTYLGRAEFTDGTVRIQRYEQFQADFSTRFQINAGVVELKHLDLLTDGAESHIGGFVDFGKWPEQEYRIESTVDLNRMRELFFANATWRMSGESKFNGVFKIARTGVFDLSGLFKSDEAGLGWDNREWRFPHLDGALQWTPTSFAVTQADMDFLGGRLALAYHLPFGSSPSSTITLTGDYNDVDLNRFTRQWGWTALEPMGRMHGHVSMAWTKGLPFSETMQGTGNTVISPLRGQTLAAATLPASAEPIPAEKPFQKYRPFGQFPLGASTSYRFSGASLDFDPSWAATPTTYVKFRGRARGGPADLAFHVTSHDWQNSDRLFAAIMSNFNRPMGGIEVGGRGTFDGTLTKEFNAPRIEGRFVAESMRAFGEIWGHATGDIAVENSYLTVTNGRVDDGEGGRIVTSGKYSLGFPRSDGGEEINANVRVENMLLPPLLRAFTIDTWPVTGVLAEAELTLRGAYTKPAGSGEMRIEKATAWGEPFEYARGALTFGGDGSMSISRIEMGKGPGQVKGDAWLSWAANAYSFNARSSPAEGGGLPIDELKSFKIERAPLTGILSFKASGSGNFDSPTWRIYDATIPDLYIGDEGVGSTTIRLSMANQVLTVEEIVTEHERLHLGCRGTIAMNEMSDAKLRCDFNNASLEPYLKFVSGELPYSRAIVTGLVTLDGPLRDRSRLTVDARIEDGKAELTLFDYKLKNNGLLQLGFRKNTFHLDRVQFMNAEGPLNETQLDLSGSADLTARTADLRASGSAGLGILQAFYPALSTNGTSELTATLKGSFDDPVLNGSAQIVNGRLRHRDMPHGLEAINGPITMQAGRISVDGLRGVMGEGRVTFSGGIVLNGYRPEEFVIHAEGRSMHLRFPKGLQSTVDADLDLRGPIKAAVLSGDVDVLAASYAIRYEPQTGLFGLLANTGGAGLDAPLPAAESVSAFPVGLAIKVRSGIIPFVENTSSGAFIAAKADVDISGTIDRPIVTGDVKVDSGRWFFSGYRYDLRSGSIAFNDPSKFDPYFDLTAETKVHTPGQNYNVTVRINGTLDRLRPTFTSDPWLPDFQIMSLLLGDTPSAGAAELNALRAPQDLQRQALQQAGAAILLSPISGTIGSAIQNATTLNVQILLSMGGDAQQVNPGARFVVGKQISRNIYLTYSRSLTGAQNEVILIEYDQNEQLSWVLSRNEDRSFALDFRLRYVFR